MLTSGSRPALFIETNRRNTCPCSSCHPAASTVAHTASAVRDLGFAGALSTAAASVLGIGYKHGLSDAPAARSAANDADANQTQLPALFPFGRRFAGNSNRLIETAPLDEARN